jgi:hypothetical protein
MPTYMYVHNAYIVTNVHKQCKLQHGTSIFPAHTWKFVYCDEQFLLIIKFRFS